MLVSLDTLRADHLSSYGYARETSPHLDQLARESIRFDEALAQAPGTLPSHLALLTSLFPPQFGITRRDGENWNQPITTLRLPEAVTTLAEVLRESGYRTVAFTGGGPVSPRYGFDQGFEGYDVSSRGQRMNKLRHCIGALEEFLAARREQADRSPVFAFLHTFDIHDPYDAPPPFDRHFTPQSSLELPPGRRYLARPPAIARRGEPLTDADAALVRGFYDNGIRATDAVLAELFELLRRYQLYAGSILVVLSDHGEEFQDHGGFGHGGRLYQEHLRVPLLIRLPGGRRGGTVVSGPVGLVDVAPTLVELAGLEVPDQFRGHSLRGLLEGRDAGHWLSERRLYADVPNAREGVRSLRRGPWKLIEDPTQRSVELYDLAADPQEQRDLAASRPELAGELLGELSAWVAEMQRDARREGTLAVETAEPLTPEETQQLRQLGYL